MWLNVFLSSLSVWVSVCMTWNKLPTASPPVYLQCPSLDLHRPVPSSVPSTAQLTTRGCHSLSTHPAGEQPPAHHHPTHRPWPRTQPPARLSAPPLHCPVAALGPSPLSWGTATLAPLVTWRALSREERRNGPWSPPHPDYVSWPLPQKSPIQPSLGHWEGTGPEQRVGLCRTPGGPRPRPCDLRPCPWSLSLRPLPVICPADPGATRVSQGHSWKAGLSGATPAFLSRFSGDWNLCPGVPAPPWRGRGAGDNTGWKGA